jgi:polyhydroxybutyrate depolymerase
MATMTLALLGGLGAASAAQSAEDGASQPSRPSVGCGAAVIEAGTYDGVLVVDGDEQRYSMLVPEAHDGVTPVPLWLQFHGAALSASDALAKVTSAATEHGFVVVAPQGSFGGPPGQYGWGWRPEDTEIDLTSANPDIAFMDALIDHVAETLCVDLTRVYAAGFSTGGGATTVAACALPDRITAAASVAGLVFDFGTACAPAQAVPFLAIHGSTDNVLHFEGGSNVDHPIKDRYIGTPIPDRVAAIAERNGCGPEATVEVVEVAGEAWAQPVESWTWDCPPGADVELLVHDGGHAWPQPWDLGYDGASLVWEFFERHALPE